MNWVVVGDGNGSIPMPDPGRTALVHEVWRGPAQVTGDLVNKNVIKATSVIPTDVGGWNVREIGLIDQDGELFAIANAPGYPKISIADGINNDMCVGMRVAVSNQAGINIKVDGTVIIATIQDIEEHDKNEDSHKGHFKNKEIHVSTNDRENWDNPLIVATVLLESEGWERDPEGVTFIQDVTDQLPEETVLPNMDLAIKADPNLTAQMVDKDIGLVAEQTGGKIVVHALREAPDINMYLQVSLYRSKSGEEKTYYSNLLGNPGEIGTPLPLPIDKGSIHLEDQSTAEQLKIHGTHTNPSIDWAATRVVRGENVGPIGPNDGVQIMDGTGTEFTDTNNLKAGVRYIYAYFPRNEAGNYQMSATTAEITIPTKKPQPPTNLQIKNSTDASAFAATLTYEAPMDVYRDHFAIVRKEGSAPTSLEDGKIVYEGAELTFRDTQNTTFGVEYHWTVFAVNAEGVVSDASPSVSLSIQPIVPEQVTELTAADASAPEYGYRVMVKCKKPADVNAYKIMVRRKAGEMPATSIDGDQVYEGSNEIFYDLPPFSSQEYFYRAFTVNQSGQMNDEQEGAVASVTLTEKEPGNVTNLSATDEKGTTTGSFDLPVVMLEGKEVVNRFVAGYVVIQKEGSVPQNETDGEVIASEDIAPAITSKTVTFTKTEQKNGANLFITVFLKNHAGSYIWSNGQVVNIVPKVFPDPPTGWSELITLTDGSGTWVPPEIGYFLVCLLGKSGDGGRGGKWYPYSYNVAANGCSGGTGGYTEIKIKNTEDAPYSYVINNSLTSFTDKLENIILIANAGTKGGDVIPESTSPNWYPAGKAGTASNNLEPSHVRSGIDGSKGNYDIQGLDSASIGNNAGKTSTHISFTDSSLTFSTTSGYGGGTPSSYAGGTGTPGKIVIYRGNTNSPIPSQVYNFTLTPGNESITATWKNRGDPVHTGTILVVNKNHVPENPTDGEVYDAQTLEKYTIANLTNGEPCYVAAFSYNSDKSTYSKGVTDSETPRTLSWYTATQEVKQDVQKVTEQAAESEKAIAETKEQVETVQKATAAQPTINAAIGDLFQSMSPTLQVNLPESAGLFASSYRVWKGGEEFAQWELISHKNIAYQVQQKTTSEEHRPPDSEGMLAIYVPYVVAGADGVKPWAYGMHVTTGDLVRDEGVVWEAKKDMKPCIWKPAEGNEWIRRDDLL